MSHSALNRKDKQVLLDFDGSVREFGRQFSEQQRHLESRTDNKIHMINDLQEFFKRRSEIDLEYGKSMDRLSDRFTERFQKQRANYGLTKKDRASFVNLWHKLLIDTKFKAKTATTLSDIYAKNICARLVDIADDVQRISRAVKETHSTLQQEVTQMVSQLQADMRHYYARHAEYIISEGKFRVSESDMKKAEDTPQKKGNDKRLKNLEKNMDKRRLRFIDCKLKATRARNAFILGAESVSTIVSKYYDHDLSSIVQWYDHNFHASFSSTLQAFIGAEIRMSNANIQSANSLAHTISIMDGNNDVKMFMEDNQGVFLPHMKFSFVPHAEDNVNTITADRDIENELRNQYHKSQEALRSFQAELQSVKVNMDKRQKLLETSYRSYDSEMNGFYHIDMTPVSGPSATTSPSSANNAPQATQLKQDKEDGETYLLSKFREHIMNETLKCGETSKFEMLSKALGDIASDPSRLSIIPDIARKKKVKLFGTNLKQQLDESSRDIPDIVESCAKYIAKYGLKHQGIFRVPGASQEIADMKTAFEEGRDPLSGLNHWKDINAVAGVFRVYFREMSEPLFPMEFNSDYLRCSCILRTEEQIAESKVILLKIKPWNLHVIKYMLKFLNLISQSSEQNKMTSHNLAVVFGPTLFRVADNDNLLTSQGQINAFIDILINEFYQIFPDEPNEGFEDACDGGERSEDNDGLQTEDELESEDEMDDLDVVALYSYTARTPKEVSFNKGDIIRVFSRTNADWWDARVNGKFGFVPAPYVKVVDRPQSVMDTTADVRRKSRDFNEDGRAKKPGDVLSPTTPSPSDNKTFAMFNPTTHSLKSASTSSVGTTEHAGNVFAAIDPTVNPASPSSIRRSGSDRSGVSGGRVNIPNRSHSATNSASRVRNKNGAPQITEDASEQQALQSTINKVSNAFSTSKQVIVTSSVPPSAAKQFNAALQESKRSDSGSVDEKIPDSVSRGSVKDRTKMFHQPIGERPLSALSKTKSQIQIEDPDKPDQVPSFKPPPPPTALKPRPGGRKNQELAAAVLTAAAAKKHEKDVTHL